MSNSMQHSPKRQSCPPPPPTQRTLPTRRVFLATASSAAASTLAYAQGQTEDKNDRPRLGLIGAGYQPETKREGRGIAIGRQAAKLGDITHICELDQHAMDYAWRTVSDSKAIRTQDYERVLEDASVDAVLIGTPDHWHAKIAIEAMRVGKDVYCEKPVAVTIDEGRKLVQTAKETGRIFQVGTQQRSEYDEKFLKAIALVRTGRIGQVQEVHVGLGAGWKGGPFKQTSAPQTLDWERWQGPAAWTDYIPERVHRSFRWWFEYAGGQICDWGVHHVDIAQWALNLEQTGPESVRGTAEWNQPLRNGMPTRTDCYNTPIEFDVRCTFPGGIMLRIDSSRNGITFTGDQGRFFVNRGTLEGKPVEQLAERPLPENITHEIYGDVPGSHMQNFFNCLRSRRQPASDIASHHRTLSTCHLANICLRLGREIHWDAETESVLNDEQANHLLTREYRKGYEIDG